MFDNEKVEMLKKVASTNDATVVGVLIIVSVTFSCVIVYLFVIYLKLNNKYEVLYEKYIDEVKSSNETNLELMKSHHQFIDNLIRLNNHK